MIRRILIIISLAFITCSCKKDMSIYSPADISKYNFFEQASVEAPQPGYLAIVTSKNTGDTLVITREATSYEKGIFDDVEVSFTPDLSSRAARYAQLPDNVMTVWNETYLVMFEDSENGDDDYNDIILWIENKKEGSIKNGLIARDLSVYPVALGCSDNTIIDFGIVLPDASEMIIKDVRKELFGSAKGFINTQCSDVKIDKKSKHTLIGENEQVEGLAIGGMRFFIEVNGKRIYAAYGGTNGDKTGINVSKNGTPCGIVVSQKYRYPREKASIFDLYPLFSKWINGTLDDTNPKPFDKISGNDIAVKID